jgi:hypothetical protein
MFSRSCRDDCEFRPGGVCLPRAEPGRGADADARLQEDEHLWTVLRYVERNPLRANVVQEADAWRWSSLWHRVHGNKSGLVDDGPRALPCRWLQHIQTPQTAAELEALRRSVLRGAPFGETSWQARTAKRLGLQSTLRARGRPCKPHLNANKDSRPFIRSVGVASPARKACTG